MAANEAARSEGLARLRARADHPLLCEEEERGAGHHDGARAPLEAPHRLAQKDVGEDHGDERAEEVDAGIKRIIAECAFIGGAEVAAFEHEYAGFTRVPHCVGVANGTDALELALRAVGVRAGDEVIVPANTFVATAEAAARVGARVVFVDIDPATYLIDVAAALTAVTPATRAIAETPSPRPTGMSLWYSTAMPAGFGASARP